MKPKLRTRREKLHCPLKCKECGEEIRIGERYECSNGSGYERHEGCYNNYTDSLTNKDVGKEPDLVL